MLLPHFVPCQQDAIGVCVFACTISVRAYPTAPTCKISMRRCAALRRPTCFKLFCTCKSHECGESASACCCTVFCNSAKVESLRARHQSTNVQRRSAWHTAPATLIARPAPVDCTICGRAAGFASANAYATRRATVELLRPFTCRCNGIRAETIAASRPALVRCAVEVEDRGSPVP